MSCPSCNDVPVTPTLNCNPVNYCTDGCVDIISAECIQYKGDNLSCTSIAKNDTVATALTKLDTVICGLTNDSGDKYVRISSTDTTSGYLLSKLVAGNYVTLNKINPNINEQIRIDVDVTSIINSVQQVPLVITSSDNTLAVTQSGSYNHTANLTVNIASDSGNVLIKKPGGLYAPETIFSPIQGVGIGITAGGAYGHTPKFDIVIDPTSNAGLTVGNDGLKLTLPAPYVPDYKVKVDVGDTPDYLENQIEVGTDPLGVVTLTITKVGGKLRITPTINVSAFCTQVSDECGCGSSVIDDIS